MNALLMLLAGVLALAGVVGWIWMVVIAFNNGEPLWGIGCLFCGIAGIVYGLMHYEEAKIPFWLLTVGFVSNIILRVAITATNAAAMAG